MEEICEKLDDLSIRNLELCDDVIKISSEIDNRLKEGWFHLAKARYVMGFNNVSSMQLDERNCDPLTYVDVTTMDDDAPTKFDTRLSDDKEKLRSLTKIFGVLTPSNVKSSQNQFVKCLSLAAELASTKEELKFVENEFEKYSKRKEKLLMKN